MTKRCPYCRLGADTPEAATCGGWHTRYRTTYTYGMQQIGKAFAEFFRDMRDIWFSGWGKR